MDVDVDCFSDEVIDSFRLLVAIGDDTTESGDVELLVDTGVADVDD